MDLKYVLFCFSSADTSLLTLKTTNLIINLDNDDWILDCDNQILAHIGFGRLLFLTFKVT